MLLHRRPEAEKRKADVVEAVAAELYQKRATHEIADEALNMLVAFVYQTGQISCYDMKSDGRDQGVVAIIDNTLAPQQTQTKTSVSRLNEWGQKQQKKISYPQEQIGGAWRVSVDIEDSLLEGAIGEASDVKKAKTIAAEQALTLLSHSCAMVKP